MVLTYLDGMSMSQSSLVDSTIVETKLDAKTGFLDRLSHVFLSIESVRRAKFHTSQLQLSVSATIQVAS